MNKPYWSSWIRNRHYASKAGEQSLVFFFFRTKRTWFVVWLWTLSIESRVLLRSFWEKHWMNWIEAGKSRCQRFVKMMKKGLHQGHCTENLDFRKANWQKNLGTPIKYLFCTHKFQFDKLISIVSVLKESFTSGLIVSFFEWNQMKPLETVSLLSN